MSTKVIASFPTTPNNHPSEDVIIVTLRSFFEVTAATLNAYDLFNYNVFIDDLQCYDVKFRSGHATYPEIAAFIDKIYANALVNDLYLWCCFDLLQSASFDFDGRYIISLLYDNANTVRPLKIPIYELTDILRNTEEIIKVVTDVRTQRIQTHNISPCVVQEVKKGHSITCAPPVYHKLKQGADGKHQDLFVVERTAEELEKLVKVTPALKPTHIAILYDPFLSHICEQQLRELVRKAFNCNLQTIRESLTDGNVDNIVFDNVYKAMSFETLCVLYVRYQSNVGKREIYSLITRAKSRLVIIDADVFQPPLTTDNVHLLTWDIDAKGDFTS